MKFRVAALLGSMAFAAGGCPTYQASFDSDDPSMRLAAAVRSANSDDPSDYPRLVEMLNDGDMQTRMLAINVLERRTGTTRGYDYAAPAEFRAGPLKEWRAWAQQYVREASPPSATTQRVSSREATR